MTSFPKNEEDKTNNLNVKTNIEKLKMLNEKEGDGNPQTTFMFDMMDDLIRAMQQLQKMIVVQVSTQVQPIPDNKDKQIDAYDKNIIDKVPKTQTAILLHQVQKAMEATVAQLSTSGRILKPLNSPEPNNEINSIEEAEIPIAELTTSEKWRLYTELVQKKDEPSKDYCLMKMGLGQDLGLSFNETKREMLIGLWSNRLCTVLFLKHHKTEDEIVDDIDEWERIEHARSEVFKKYRNKNYHKYK